MVAEVVQNVNWSARQGPGTVVGMTTTLDSTSTDARFVALAAEVGRRAAATDAEHDRDATFVTEAYDAMRETGYLGLAVPGELGGLGASWRQVVLAQHELARWSGSAALASAMHQYLTLVQRWRHHRDAHGAARGVMQGLGTGPVRVAELRGVRRQGRAGALLGFR